MLAFATFGVEKGNCKPLQLLSTAFPEVLSDQFSSPMLQHMSKVKWQADLETVTPRWLHQVLPPELSQATTRHTRMFMSSYQIFPHDRNKLQIFISGG